jgi:prepilin-type N-terminal cleavage/methylation domain-containing protein
MEGASLLSRLPLSWSAFPWERRSFPRRDIRFFMRQHAGFTLIELLTVCAILVALSYLAWGAYLDVDRRAEDELARAELLRLADALRRFHDDTGYWPGEGPFQLNSDCTNLSDIHAVDSREIGLDDGLVVGADKGQWFDSPANLFLLFKKPVLCPGHRLAFLEHWNADAHRGWHGPYLPTNKRHWVDFLPTGKLVNIPAFGVGPAFAPNAADVSCATDLNKCAFNWRSLLPSIITINDSNGDGVDDVTGYEPAKYEFARHARPFLFFLNPPRVVYAGEDGRYGGADPDDPDPCRPAALSDDVVICL